eukprot:TRINITY_DN4374_c3_g3_i1.p1 TRINITY_DN4374_c3_g3~~TRINITY_DN4374_c3_g3_i1.p1  ORF type:complete len:373 (+),score=82.27 TRINITY_DN4374_c3_g3_i1:172-1290(+)
MIQYDSGNWGLGFIFSLKGSVFPKALVIALPNALLAYCLHFYSDIYPQPWMDTAGVNKLWGSYTFLLGFLIVFRNSQAYGRFRMGCKLQNEIDGEWIDAASSFVAFASQEPEKREKVDTFLHLMIRLFSMLHCAALQTISDCEDDSQEIIDPDGIDPAAMEYLMSVDNKVDVLLAWIRELGITAAKEGLLVVPPPILGRAFQELSAGHGYLMNLKQIRYVSFPFPYAQILTVMIMTHWIVTPIFASQAIQGATWAAATCCCVVLAIWSMYYIALELDQPFGDDANDMPLRDFQVNFNENLLLMIKPEVYSVPNFELEGNEGQPKLIESKTIWHSEKSALKRKEYDAEIQLWDALKQPLTTPYIDDALKAPLP